MSKITIAKDAWGETLPDWIEALAQACDRTSQNKVAAQLARSASLVSTVLSGKYQGDMAAVEEIVRGVLMHETVDCPALGDVEKQVCRMWRERGAQPLDPINTQYVQMHRACRHCHLFEELAE